MKQAKEVMTRSLAAVSPETTVSEVARVMRDRNIGDVLIAENGELKGIVTDRDLAIRALSDGVDARQVPVREFMSPNPITGEPKWELSRVAEVMAKHQVRRLPIVEHNKIVGIVSLGDVAINDPQRPAVASSLRDISQPLQIHQMERARSNGGAVPPGLVLGLAVGAAVALLMTPKPGREIREQLADTDWNKMRTRFDNTDWRGVGSDLAGQARARLEESSLYAAVMPRPKRKRFIFF